MSVTSAVAVCNSRDRACILVVDDEVLIRLVIADALRDSGYSVVEAGSGDEALALFAAGLPIDLLITDVRMPGSIDGLQLAAAARAMRPDLLIAVSSAHVVAGSEPGAEVVQAFLPKPYLSEKLLALVDRLLAAP